MYRENRVIQNCEYWRLLTYQFAHNGSVSITSFHTFQGWFFNQRAPFPYFQLFSSDPQCNRSMLGRNSIGGSAWIVSYSPYLQFGRLLMYVFRNHLKGRFMQIQKNKSILLVSKDNCVVLDSGPIEQWIMAEKAALIGASMGTYSILSGYIYQILTVIETDNG